MSHVTINIHNRNVLLVTEPQVVRIVNNEELMDLLQSFGSLMEAGKVIADRVLEEHWLRERRELHISRDSLAAEIVGHAMAIPLLEQLRKKVPSVPDRIIDTLREKAEHHVDVIDCGEGQVDSNRWVWDILGFLF
ncbi:hypothetical protein M3650_17970 [Paenibacillus sp. MER TA 81-3]|uniref:hypothetical protein n=1 Tax=Paenibacillus sp. MER TA 81-3 TaxID=2939573 RepID=UPI00203D1D0C|nr:hypothetical protein [Paenibacillus sp. MER TA 81-3]MCM3340476.1 hypothetical protein [Paenibacillus sp. MER TA 81-3]